MIWGDYQNKCIAELEFKSEVKAIKLRRDRYSFFLFSSLTIKNECININKIYNRDMYIENMNRECMYIYR